MLPVSAAHYPRPLLQNLLWPNAPRILQRPDTLAELSMDQQNSSHRITLALSLSEDGALQQVLTDGNGQMLVGEKPFFLSWARSVCGLEVDTSKTIDFENQPPHPMAPRINNALRLCTPPINIICTPELASFPWAGWLPKGTIFQLSCKPNVSDSISYAQFLVNKPPKLSTQWPQRGHRNVISLSYDLVGSTALMSRIGAESYSQLLSKFHATFASITANWSGQMDTPQGDDGCMCYFGAVSADEHAGPAALRAALEMQNAAQKYGWDVRIGIASGWAAVDVAQPVGLTVHLAARLQKLAQVGAIYVNNVLAKDCAAEFDFLKLTEEVKLKGFDDAQQVMQLLSAVRKRDIDNYSSNATSNLIFMGRTSLLALLNAGWCGAEQGAGCDVLVVGQPGIGKSTAMRYWQATLASKSQFTIHCGPHDYRQPFASLSQWVAKQLNFSPTGNPTNQLTHLHECLLHQSNWVPHLLALLYLFDLPLPDMPSILEDPAARHQHVIESISQWIIKRSLIEPVLCIVEDYQWIDASTAAFISSMRDRVDRSARIMLVVTQRPALQRQPTYAARGMTHDMEPLTALESQQLIANLSPQIRSDRDLMCLLETRARGVPLFLKESVLLLSTPGYQERLQTARRLGIGMPVPDSLQDLLMQRLDQLGEARKIAQLGSVLGQQFSWDMLKAVATALNVLSEQGDNLEDICKKLEQENVWIYSNDLGHQRIEFSHALIRDVAYQSMWETDRKHIHSLAAKVLQSDQLSGIDAIAPELGRHLAAAGEIELAVDHLLKTGKQSKKKGAHQVATQTMETALELLALVAPSETTNCRLIEAHLALAGQILITQGYASTAVRDHYGCALQLSEALGDHKAILRAQLGLESFYFMRGDFAMAHRLIDAARITAAHVQHPLTMLQYDWARANLMFYEGKLVECAELMRTCIEWCEVYGLGNDLIQNPYVMAIMYRAFSLCCLGRTNDALELACKGCDLAQQSTNRLTRLQAFGIAAMVEYGCGRWKQTLLRADNAIESCQPGEYSLWLAHAGVMRGAALAQLGSHAEGIEIMRSSHTSWAEHGGMLTRTYYWTLEADILQASGDYIGARHVIKQAQKMMQEIPERYFSTEVQRIAACLKLDELTGSVAKHEAYQELLSAFDDATHRQLFGLALRVATSLYQYAQQTSWSDPSQRSESRDRLTDSLNRMQDSAITADILHAQSCLELQPSAKIIQIDQYKRA